MVRVMDVVIGIDVGTGSARVGVFSIDGRKVATAVLPTRTWRPKADFAQQSTADIWSAVCRGVREAMVHVPDARVCGIGFDATCSLAVVGPGGAPLSIDPDGAAEQDVILWADHRAIAEADEINAGGYDVLRYVGGVISPEMETPKLLWLSRHMPDVFAQAERFFDLPDYLTWRATGSDARSCCSTTCKWTYLAHEQRWDDDFFRRIGLGVLVDEGFRRIGTDIRALGGHVGRGLSARAAEEMGLPEGTPVGVSAIDAHAGGIALLGAVHSGDLTNDDTALNRSIALICGTSSCHMAVSRNPRFVRGVWGPYSGAMVPDMWLNEAGQSATGALIDFIVDSHPAAAALRAETGDIYRALNAQVEALEAGAIAGTSSRNLHIQPDFFGNRSPYADPTARGAVVGLPLSATVDDLARLYLATIQGLAYGTRDILDVLNREGYDIRTISATGGLTKNPLYLREHANATGCAIILPREPDAVLLGAAILGAMAAKIYPSLGVAMARMSHAGDTIRPDEKAHAFHRAKMAVFRDLHRDQLRYREMMNNAARGADIREAERHPSG
jgi:FGGY-family pentulose kinase